jgi:hypothetical protein
MAKIKGASGTELLRRYKETGGLNAPPVKTTWGTTAAPEPIEDEKEKPIVEVAKPTEQK